MLIVGIIVVGAVVLTTTFMFIMGFLEGFDDATDNEYYQKINIKNSLEMYPIVWHGWYVAYYGRRGFREAVANNGMKDRMRERREEAIQRREDRRMDLIERRHG